MIATTQAPAITRDTPLEMAMANHDPDRYEGRSWEELSLLEQEAALTVAEDRLRQ